MDFVMPDFRLTEGLACEGRNLFIFKNLVSHRGHRDHRGETNRYYEITIHLLGEPAEQKNTTSFSVFSVNSVA
jgi:hypothetical protein